MFPLRNPSRPYIRKENMHKRKLVKVYKYEDDIRVSVELSGPDPDGMNYIIGDEEEDVEPTHTESMFVMKRGVKHTGWPKGAYAGGLIGLRSRGRTRGAWKVSKNVMSRARRTILKSRWKQFVVWKAQELWNRIDILDWVRSASAFATLALLILLFFKEHNGF
jgi:hypothetical protein